MAQITIKPMPHRRESLRVLRKYILFTPCKRDEDVLKSNMIDAGEPASINLHQRKYTARMSWQICDRSIFSLRPLSTRMAGAQFPFSCAHWMKFA